MSRDERLDTLTSRWRARHDLERAGRMASGNPRPPADEERIERARTGFPWRDTSPASYVARHGREMTGYTYDDYAYPDAELQAWLDEVGSLLRSRRKLVDR
jgi:hypothetical protein